MTILVTLFANKVLIVLQIRIDWPRKPAAATTAATAAAVFAPMKAKVYGGGALLY